MKAAILVKSPFSHSVLFGFTVAPFDVAMATASKSAAAYDCTGNGKTVRRTFRA
jgi:hypothetical protein